MTLSLFALCLLGSFYTVLGVVIVRRVTKPSCRNCVHWQDCSLSAQLGSPNLPCERCEGNRTEL
jgi:hypothetical protein